MSAILLPVWIALCAVAAVLAIRSVRASRGATGAPASRALLASVPVGAAVLAIIAVAILGIAPAVDGAERMSEPSASRDDARSPARARLFLRQIRIEPDVKRIGYSPDADVVLPRLYQLTESARAWDLLELDHQGDILTLRERERPEPTPTRIRLLASADASAGALRVLAKSCADVVPTAAVRGPIVSAALCTGSSPRAVLSFESRGSAILMTARVWRRQRLEPHHIEIEPRGLVQIGAAAAAVPGVTMWEVPAPRGRSELFSAPADLLGPCSDFASSVYAGSTDREPPASSSNASAVCVVPFAPPFALEVRRLRPDVAGVAARGVWAAAILLLPLLLWSLALFIRRRSNASVGDVADLTRFAVLTVAVCAIFAVRLLWSHRIDMLRDWAIYGSRVTSNLVTIAAVAAGLALAASLAILRAHPRRLAISVGVFFFALTSAWLTAPTELGAPSMRGLGQFFLAAVFGSVSLWRVRAGELLESSPHRAALAISAAALTTHLVAPRAVAIKLLLSTVAIVACYRALRAGFQDSETRRLIIGVAAATTMLVSLALLDTGLAVVLAVPGFLIATMIAGHDALFGTKALTEVQSYRLRQAPLIWIQGGLLGVLVIAVLAWATYGLLVSGDPTLARNLTLGAPHLLWVIAALFAAPALIAHRRGDARTAALFGGAAMTVVGAWLARNGIAELVLSSSAPAAQRYAVIADPGYSLLADPRAFLSGITGWAETIFGASENAFVGAGFFGAQLIDPGVLLSVENDYLPVLMLRELGVMGMTLWAVTSLGMVFTAWLAGRELTSIAGPAARGRLAVLAVIVIVIIYQPLASLGALPLTGVSWLGLGVDSPSDLWMMLGVLGYLCAAGHSSTTAADSRHERSLRTTKRFLRKERWVAAAAGLATITGVLVIARASTFAVSRPMPVAADGTASAPFVGLEAALDYAQGLRCSLDDGGYVEIDGNPSDPATARFHRRLLAEIAQRSVEPGQSVGVGLVTARVSAGAGDVGPRCRISLERRALSALRVKPNRPYKHSRVRLVSSAMGRAAGDHGELVSGDIAIRLRASAETIELPRAAGIYAARSVALGDQIAVTASSNGEVQLERTGEDKATPHWLFVSSQKGPAIGVRPTSQRSSWTEASALTDAPVILERDALIVIGRGVTRNVWLFRATRPTEDNNPLGDGPRSVGSLLADDAQSVTGARRRLYVYGNDIPELGWVNPFRRRGSVGLDGWISAALAEWAPDSPAEPTQCGTLAPPPVNLTRVCTADASEGVIECKLAIQPELTIRMRHLTEMIAAAPSDFLPDGAESALPRPLRASFMLMRGDTAEITAQGSFIPGRASPAYAPTTAALESHLIRLREDRDPKTGAELPRRARGEASAEKLEHNRALAVGSVFKPMLARAFEQTAPTLTRRLVLSGTPTVGAACRGGRSHAIFGHCPPTDSLWNQRRELSMDGFVGHSANWFLAALALVGTSLPNGSAGLGDGPALNLDELLDRNVGDHQPQWRLWTKDENNNTIIGPNGKIAVEQLRKTPMWQRFEAIMGRQLCTSGNKAGCERNANRRDLCAARAMPIAKPSADLRQLVSLGPDRFDFYPRLKNRERRVERVSSREYLQFLRGSGVHPIGSIAQMTDAFNRVIYEADRDPLRDGPYRLAATWFPSPPVGEIPSWNCQSNRSGSLVTRGVCEVLGSGTASRALRSLLSDPRVEIYGAKTGTVDSLGDVAARSRSCEQFRQAHTLSDRRAAAESQPYWLECGANAEADDSLLVISFAVKTSAGGRIPLTLGLAFQRSGSGMAPWIARHYIDVIADYFAAGEKGLP